MKAYMKRTFSILLFVIVNLHSIASLGQASGMRPAYLDSLNQVVKILKEGRSPNSELIDYCIPESQKESLAFFQLDYKKESTSEFRKLMDYIDKLSLEGREPTIRKFIVLSQFVDGYFAEDYFDSAEKICKAKRKTFCRIFTAVDADQKQRLIDHGITCKSR